MLTEEISREEAKRRWPDARSNKRVWRQGVTVPTPATEARKIGRLVNQFGDAVANKVDREVVKPVRDGLQDVVDLINS